MGKSKSYDFEEIMEVLKLEKLPEEYGDTWKQSMESFPEDKIWFLESSWLLEANLTLDLTQGEIEALLHSAELIRSDLYLSRFAWHYYYLIFEKSLGEDPWSFKFPSLDHYMGYPASLFYVVILISGLNTVLKQHTDKGIDRKITIHTFSDLHIWMKHYFDKYGRYGLNLNQWLILHFTGGIYRLGRLQFVPTTFSSDIMVFKNIRDRQVIALSAIGIRYRNDGQVDGSSGVYDSDYAWVSRFEVCNGFIRGNPITPNGFAVREMIELNMEDWSMVLSKGDLVLDIHIPDDSRLDMATCGDSMRMAAEFFPRYFPELSYCAFVCATWFLDAQYQNLLPPTSNIVKFQREFYLYPVQGTEENTFNRVFGGIPDNLSKAPRDTLLRKAILDHVTSGGHLRDAGGFLLREDLDWEKAVYR